MNHQQLTLPLGISLNKIVNVASVRHLSPFRYPGGKTWLVPRVRLWLTSMDVRPSEFIEPFAGGSIIGLTVAYEKFSKHVTLVELDDQVAAVWRVIINGEGDAEALANRILGFEVTNQSIDTVLNREPETLEDKAFQTLLKNRVNHGGILAPGAGRIKRGEDGKGVKSRWYPETLHKRILNILKFRDRVTFIQGDGIQVLKQNMDNSDAVFFIDPPYTAGNKKAGSRLYAFSELNHEELFEVASTIKGDFLMTYDNDQNVHDLANRYDFDVEAIAMKSTHHAEMTELLISKNLDWVRESA